ncbi:porin family protein [uncultured Cyclobacterium sp.]|uniref:porin family protein n=1 Tax=uncultured Cyclobacterium sp. TaxID=453820 RepID=UPI0030EBD3CA|tara:strand:- start:283847 stop:284524 length:678 start_codon:yes stop_codon:yes gene_type:complete
MLKNAPNKKFVGILAALFLLFGTAHTFGQTNNPGPKFGIKGGLNLSQLYVDQPTVEDESMKAGFNFGVFGKIPINSFLAVQPEVLYSNTGSKLTYGGSDLENVLGIESGEVRFNLNYVQVPIALAVNVGPLNLHAGPYLSYLVSANVKDLKNSDLSSTDVATLDTDDFNKFDYGAMFGVGFDVKAVTIGVRYNYGFREIGNSGIAGQLTENSKNGVGQIYIGIGL